MDPALNCSLFTLHYSLLSLPVAIKLVRLLGGDRGAGELPDLAFPFAKVVDQLQRGLRVCGVTFEADDLGHDGYLGLGILGNGQTDLAADAGQVARQIDERAVRADILGQAFLYDLLAVIVFPSNADRERDDVPLPFSPVLNAVCHVVLGAAKTRATKRIIREI